MANLLSSKKDAIKAEKSRQHNASRSSKLRTYIKKVILALDAKNIEAARAAFKELEPLLDRLCLDGLVHKNKAARHKSRLSARIKQLSQPAK